MTDQVRDLMQASGRSNKTSSLLLRTYPETLQALDDMSKRTGCTRTALIEFAIQRLRVEDVLARLHDIRSEVAYPFPLLTPTSPQDDFEVPDFD